jgi:hypothetical protein
MASGQLEVPAVGRATCAARLIHFLDRTRGRPIVPDPDCTQIAPAYIFRLAIRGFSCYSQICALRLSVLLCLSLFKKLFDVPFPFGKACWIGAISRARTGYDRLLTVGIQVRENAKQNCDNEPDEHHS